MANLLDLPSEMLTVVCLQLDLLDLFRVAGTCRRFRFVEGALQTAELPTNSPVITALRELADAGGVQIPSARPTGCSESWVAYLCRCVRQHRCREAPPFAAGDQHSLFLDAAGRLLTCGTGAAVGHGYGERDVSFCAPTPVAVMAEVRLRSVAAGTDHSLALGWDGRVFSWGRNHQGQLGHGDLMRRHKPKAIRRFRSVCNIAAGGSISLAVTETGDVLQWGKSFWPEAEEDSLSPVLVEGLGGVHVRRVCVCWNAAFAIGQDGELFSWGNGSYWRLGHGDHQESSPERVEALRDVRVSMVSAGREHALALAEDGLVYAWGRNDRRALLGNSDVKRELLPKPVEALRGVRMSSIAAADGRSYAVTDTGVLWAWGVHGGPYPPVGHGGQVPPHWLDIEAFLPKPIESMQGIKVHAVSAHEDHTLALAHDGRGYAWGSWNAVMQGVLGVIPTVLDIAGDVCTPHRIPALRVGCGL
jgi:alpha-tubulin suppressor-like RCC1 family protein